MKAHGMRAGERAAVRLGKPWAREVQTAVLKSTDRKEDGEPGTPFASTQRVSQKKPDS